MNEWKIEDHTTNKHGYIRIADENGKTVCDIFPFGTAGGVGLEVARKNARKIVNAERLYDALIDMVAWCEEGCQEGSYGTICEARDVIKAIDTGEKKDMENG